MIAVVILNWNGAEMLRRFLPSVVEHSHPLGEVIVADNGSTDNSLEILQEEFPEVRTLVLDHNYGFAEGYNEAFRRLEEIAPHHYDYYLLLNSDVRVTSQWLRPLHTYMEQHPEVAAAQPKIRAEWAHDTLEYAGASGGFIDRYGYPFCRGRLLSVVEKDHGQYDDIASIFWATGAALLIRQSDWWQVGGLDGRFFAHNEEIDLCWRLRARGRGIVCIPESVVYHVGGGTLPQEHPRKTYLNFRNSLFMLLKNLPAKGLYTTIFLRMVLDGIAGVRFLLQGKPRFTWEVIRAHFHFYKQFFFFKKKRPSKLITNYYQVKSIVWEYFVLGKK